MNDPQDLASRIHEMREDGLSVDEVRSTLGIPWGMSEAVRWIARNCDTEALLSSHRRAGEEVETLRTA